MLNYVSSTHTHCVLKPESLRQEMIGILKNMTKSYETGECLNGEEYRLAKKEKTLKVINLWGY